MRSSRREKTGARFTQISTPSIDLIQVFARLLCVADVVLLSSQIKNETTRKDLFDLIYPKIDENCNKKQTEAILQTMRSMLSGCRGDRVWFDQSHRNDMSDIHSEKPWIRTWTVRHPRLPHPSLTEINPIQSYSWFSADLISGSRCW